MKFFGPFLILAFATACGTPDAPRPRQSTAKIDTLPGGIVRVRNPEPSTQLNWRFVEEGVIQPAEGAGELGEVRGVVAANDGRVAVMQTAPDQVKIFDQGHTFLRSIGRSGDGPGEFRSAAIGIRGDTLVVHDATHSRTSLFQLDGTFLTSWRAPCCMVGIGEIWVDDNGLVWIISMGRSGGIFQRYRLDGTLVDSVAVTPHKPGGTWMIRGNGSGPAGMAVAIPNYPQTLWTRTGDGRFVYASSDQYRIIIGRNGLDTARIIEASGEGRGASDAERDSLLRDALPRSIAGRDALLQAARREDIPERWPVIRTVAVDPVGRFWVDRPGNSPGRDLLEVFSPEGVRLGGLPSPHPRLLNGYWAGERIYLRDEDQEGKPLVRVFRLYTTPGN